MEINISQEMAMVVVSALAEHCNNNGLQAYGKKGEYQVTNEEALEFFEEVMRSQQHSTKSL